MISSTANIWHLMLAGLILVLDFCGINAANGDNNRENANENNHSSGSGKPFFEVNINRYK